MDNAGEDSDTTSSSSNSQHLRGGRRRRRLIFPDVLIEQCRLVKNRSVTSEHDDGNNNDNDDDDDDDARITSVFFELANADEVLYRRRQQRQQQQFRNSSTTGDTSKVDTPTTNDDNNNNDRFLLFHQDTTTACHQHTGGIIWETSYLLLEYLLLLLLRQQQQQQQRSGGTSCFGRILELGAGVGFLGQCLAAEQQQCCCADGKDTQPTIILTDTAQVLPNLLHNISLNNAAVLHPQPQSHPTTVCNNNNNNDNNSTDAVSNTCRPNVVAHALDWTTYEKDIQQHHHLLSRSSIDTLLGTDILFAPALVQPLLQTAQYLSHKDTVWYLCVQMRCPTSHAMFLSHAPQYGFVVEDISTNVYAEPGCAWGRAMDCLVYRITRAE